MAPSAGSWNSGPSWLECGCEVGPSGRGGGCSAASTWQGMWEGVTGGAGRGAHLHGDRVGPPSRGKGGRAQRGEASCSGRTCVRVAAGRATATATVIAALICMPCPLSTAANECICREARGGAQGAVTEGTGGGWLPGPGSLSPARRPCHALPPAGLAASEASVCWEQGLTWLCGVQACGGWS